MNGAFEQYRKPGALATLSHRCMRENCCSLHFIGMNVEKMPFSNDSSLQRQPEPA
jgi:hypothetical protein